MEVHLVVLEKEYPDALTRNLYCLLTLVYFLKHLMIFHSYHSPPYATIFRNIRYKIERLVRISFHPIK
jgi:hypothetical protein